MEYKDPRQDLFLSWKKEDAVIHAQVKKIGEYVEEEVLLVIDLFGSDSQPLAAQAGADRLPENVPYPTVCGGVLDFGWKSCVLPVFVPARSGRGKRILSC